MDSLEIQSSPPSSSASSPTISMCNTSANNKSRLSKSKRKAGRTKFKETRHPIYKGVRQKNSSKWVCEVREPNKKSRIWLGTFSTPEKAARAYDVAVLALRGETGELNFPDSAWSLQRAESSAPKDIQMAAFEAAKMNFQVPSDNNSSSSSSSSSISPRLTALDTKQEITKRYSLTAESVSDETLGFVDDEAMFNMPGFIDSMAEGLLITPPAMKKGFNWNDEQDFDIGLTLWNH